jgi:hypothetical protein
MSELARRLIAEAEADLASRLQAIEAHTALIEEAETLAATLRHHGIATRCNGSTFAGWVGQPAKCRAWAHIDGSVTPDALLTAFGAAELRVAAIEPGDYLGTLRIEGIAAPVHIENATAHALLQRLMQDVGRLTEGLLHG